MCSYFFRLLVKKQQVISKCCILPVLTLYTHGTHTHMVRYNNRVVIIQKVHRNIFWFFTWECSDWQKSKYLTYSRNRKITLKFLVDSIGSILSIFTFNLKFSLDELSVSYLLTTQKQLLVNLALFVHILGKIPAMII